MTILLYSVLGNSSSGIFLVVVWLSSLQMEKGKEKGVQMTSDLENTTCEGRLKELGSQTDGKWYFKSQEVLLCP